MNGIGGRIKQLRKKRGWTQPELAEKVNVSSQVVSNWERGYSSLSHEDVAILSIVFDVPSDELLGPSKIEDIKRRNSSTINQALEKMKKENAEEKLVATAELVKIPIYGEIKAGYDSVAEQIVVGYDVVSRKDVDDGEYFFLIVKGESMIEEGIKEGCRVLVKSQDYVDNGKIGVVLVNGDEATLKRVFYEGNMIVLQASNRNIPPRVLSIDDVKIQGQVKQVVFDV